MWHRVAEKGGKGRRLRASSEAAVAEGGSRGWRWQKVAAAKCGGGRQRQKEEVEGGGRWRWWWMVAAVEGGGGGQRQKVAVEGRDRKWRRRVAAADEEE